ncbi:hypothetical protein HF313_31250 [Massilia atriviolacea]|uniref:Uncharacterized protein n=1 Tax=Massilia atriviolacea TaxID=2495579 RepID=A0A430HPP8_9BURK|nr:hypothetical protein [Massilia atriviolacea]RSZ59490.1 hypothetical protein EJB06_10075 [Massilia atriviolacea]
MLAHLHARGGTMSVDDALGLAVDAWLAAQTAGAADREADGYQWKCLLLPHGTHLRMHVDGRTEYATVVGDAGRQHGRRESDKLGEDCAFD